MTIKHYEHLARRHLKLNNEIPDSQVFTTANPEQIFWESLTKLLTEAHSVLDLGCGDGRFTHRVLGIPKRSFQLVAVDGAPAMVKLAKQCLSSYAGTKVLIANAGKLPFQGNSFDLIYSRRGPTLTSQHDILSPRGYYLELRVGEQDTASLQTSFGRGQFLPITQSAAVSLRKTFGKGWLILKLDHYHYREYFSSIDRLFQYLRSTPSIPQFGEYKHDRSLLKHYAQKYRDPHGVFIDRHRIIFLARHLSSRSEKTLKVSGEAKPLAHSSQFEL